MGVSTAVLTGRDMRTGVGVILREYCEGDMMRRSFIREMGIAKWRQGDEE